MNSWNLRFTQIKKNSKIKWVGYLGMVRGRINMLHNYKSESFDTWFESIKWFYIVVCDKIDHAC